MWTQLLPGVGVSVVNFAIHAVVTAGIVLATRHTAEVTSEMGMFVRLSSLLFITLLALMCAHIAEITVWSGYYAWVALKLNNATFFEFAFENYTALGYGDPVPPEGKRLIGPITALNGLLLIGWSVAIIFEVMRMAQVQVGRLTDKDES